MPGWSLEVTLDAVDAERAARFWAAALGYRLLYERPPYRVLGPVEGAPPGPRLLVQQVPARPAGGGPTGGAGPTGGVGPTSGDQRVHLDLRVPEPEQEVQRLLGLGATLLREVDERDRGGSRWWVLADPEGTQLCVCPER